MDYDNKKDPDSYADHNHHQELGDHDGHKDQDIHIDHEGHKDYMHRPPMTTMNTKTLQPKKHENHRDRNGPSRTTMASETTMTIRTTRSTMTTTATRTLMKFYSTW